MVEFQHAQVVVDVALVFLRQAVAIMLYGLMGIWRHRIPAYLPSIRVVHFFCLLYIYVLRVLYT